MPHSGPNLPGLVCIPKTEKLLLLNLKLQETTHQCLGGSEWNIVVYRVVKPFYGGLLGPSKVPLFFDFDSYMIDTYNCQNVELSTGPQRCNVQRWRSLNERKICVFNIINISIC